MKKIAIRISLAVLEGALCVLLIAVLGSAKNAAADTWQAQCQRYLGICETDCTIWGGWEQQLCDTECEEEYSECADAGTGSGQNAVCKRLCFNDWGTCLGFDTPEDCGDELTQCLSSCNNE